jgi:hypothetical protein
VQGNALKKIVAKSGSRQAGGLIARFKIKKGEGTYLINITIT